MMEWLNQKQRACLDHIYCNHCNFVERVINKNVTGYDHNMISVRLKLLTPVHEKKSMEVRNIKDLDPMDFLNEFALQDHDAFMLADDVDDMVDVLVKNIIKTLDRVAPSKKVVIDTRHAQYLTPELRDMIKTRNEMRRTAEATGKQEDWSEFKSFRNLLRRKLEDRSQSRNSSSLPSEGTVGWD